MATESLIDIAALTAPIEGDSPAGENIRQDASPTSIYYRIKDARTGARNSERQLERDDDPDQASIIVPEWATVLDTAPEILKSHAKDLEVAAWYAEGLLRHHGIAGLRDGFRLIHGLVEGFWDDLHPMPDEDGLETRVAPLIGLNGEDSGGGTLKIPLNKVRLTVESTYPSFAIWNYEQAREIEKIADPKKKDERISAGAVTIEMIKQGVLDTPPQQLNDLKDDLEECIDAFTKMTAALDERCGYDAPPSSNITNQLNRIKDVVGSLTKDLKPSAPVAEAEAQPAAADNVAAPVGAASPATAVAAAPAAAAYSIGDAVIGNREDAHRIMLKVADFFRETEPHSPVSYALEQAVRWSNMPLPELLGELIGDERVRQDYFKVTGIPVPEDGGGKRRK